jgi:hypothetical protein
MLMKTKEIRRTGHGARPRASVVWVGLALPWRAGGPRQGESKPSPYELGRGTNPPQKKDVNYDDRSGEFAEKKGLEKSEVDRSGGLTENKGVMSFLNKLFKMSTIWRKMELRDCI